MAALKQYPIAGGDNITQSAIVDPSTGILTWQWLKWFQDVHSRVQTAIKPNGVVVPDAAPASFARQTYVLGEGTLAPQTNLTFTSATVPGAGPGSLIVANFVGLATGQPFFISLACWWDSTVGAINIEVSNNSTSLAWIYDDISISIGVMV